MNFLIGLDGTSTLTTTKYNKTTTAACTVLGLIQEVEAHNESLEVRVHGAWAGRNLLVC